MGRIQSNVGLITGIPITDTVNQLIEVAARPRDLLTSRTEGLQQTQIAINTLSSRVLSLKFDLDRLNVADPYQARSVTSSDTSVLTATTNGNGQPPLGNFNLRPARVASSQQLISQRFDSLDDIQSAGALTFGFGGFVDKGISLDDLNDGNGVARGQIKITDLAGNSSVIDLTLAQSVDDVLDAINNDFSINVTAAVDGDTFTLTDTVGGADTFFVEEINGGTTAADLGLTTAAVGSVITGADVFQLHSDTKLSALNDGNGVRFTDSTEFLDDLKFTLADGTGTELDPDTNEIIEVGVDLSGATTLGDVVDAINNDADLKDKVTAAISSDGNRLEITDLTAGAGSFTITSGEVGSAAEDLGLTTTASGGTITGTRLVSGLKDTLLSSLGGGQGFALGSIEITDRAGDDETVSLASAETLSDVVELINNAGSINVSASINEARNGITIVDQSGGNGNLVIANADANNTADALGITLDAAQDSINSGSLNRQKLSEATLLASLDGGKGITPSDLRITDKSGDVVAIDLNATGNEAKTIGDVIDAINNQNANGNTDVVARINDTGDGILLIDTGNTSGTLLVEDVNGDLGEKLGLTRAATTLNIEGTDRQVIDGTNSFSVDLTDLGDNSSTITLASLNNGSGVDAGDIKITDSAGGVTTIDFNGTDADILTVGQLIDAINDRAAEGKAQVTAAINSTGTGIELTDNANGDGDFTVVDINGSAAADLNILSTDSTTNTINGFGLFEAQTESQGALNNIATKINNLESGVTASVINDGKGFRLQLTVDETGSANEILLDAGISGFEFTETSQARDGLLVVGEGSIPGSGVLVSSSTNEFEDVVNGVDLTAVTASDTSVEITVEQDDQELVDLVQSFVDSYNTLRDDLGELTAFDENDLSTGLLFGTSEALRVDTELSRLITDRYVGLGEFQSLQSIGISVDDGGKLSLDTGKLKEAFAEDSQSLQTLFTSKDRGVVAKFNATIDRLAGAENGVLTNRNDSLQATIDANKREN